MQPSRAPLFTLVALTAAAAAVLGGGVLSARRVDEERRQVGREELEAFSAELAGELRRLEALYDRHLEMLAERVPRGSEIAMRESGEHLIGLRQISWVPWEGRGTHAEYPLRPGSGGARTPVPVARGNAGAERGSRPVLELDLGFPGGWEGDFFYQWSGDKRAFVVFAVDRAEVAAAVRGHLGRWYGVPFEPAAAAGALAAIEGPGGAVLAAGVGTRQPDLVLPVATRFGRWRVAAWDEVEAVVRYDVPTVAAASVGALLVGLLGFAMFAHQRRWARLAERRVSFVNRVSHELRTPLTNILLNADLASEALDTDAAASGRRLGLVREEAGRLARLIGNVLSFARSERGELELAAEPVRLEGLAEAALAPFRPALRRRGMRMSVEVESGAAALADPDACSQVLTNLISNAEKYAAAGGELRVAGGLAAGGDSVWLSVEDRGPGIPAGAEERIFGAFERLSERVDEGSSGTGLGLAIARDLARRMGGELRCARRDGGGARFVLELPAAPANVVALGDRLAS